MRLLVSALVVLLLEAPAWATGPRAAKNSHASAMSSEDPAVAPGILYPPLPTNLSPPTYDYAVPETCTQCHFTLGLDHTARVVGVLWNGTTWQLTGSGWLESRHAQSDHGTTENTFCAKCHSPLQASASAGFDNGAVVNASVVPAGQPGQPGPSRFQAVTCVTCHPPNNITAQIGALDPNAIDGGGIAIYLWKGYNNPASYQTLDPGLNPDGSSKEDALCLNCHEQRHSLDDAAFQAMYFKRAVRCIDCHMAPYQTIGGGNTGLPLLEEHFHDWNVGADLPHSCGAEGSVSGCHFNKFSKFTVTDAQNIIPFIREQHMEWWSLPPFSGPQVAVNAHGAPTLADYKVLTQEISKIDAMRE